MHHSHLEPAAALAQQQHVLLKAAHLLEPAKRIMSGHQHSQPCTSLHHLKALWRQATEKVHLILQRFWKRIHYQAPIQMHCCQGV